MNKLTNAHLLLAGIIIFSGFATAQIYKTTDEQGNVKFTDNPPPDAEATPVEIEQTNTARSIELPATQEAELEEEEKEGYKSLSISSPAADTIFPNGLLPTPVSVNLAPALKEGHKLRARINGQVVASSQSTSFEIPPPLARGTLSLQVEVVGGDKVLIQSAPVTIHAFRPG